MLKSNRGMITISFLFVFIIIFFFFLIFFCLVITFAHVSVTQYMSYSTARRLSLSGESEQRQREQAKDYYNKLRAKFFDLDAHAGGTGDWFNIPPTFDSDSKNFLGFEPSDFFPEGPNRNRFYGAGLKFTSRITGFRIPLIMEEDFPPTEAVVRSFLGREPSKAECQDFNKKRGDEIKRKYSSSPLSSFAVDAVNDVEGDNGC